MDELIKSLRACFFDGYCEDCICGDERYPECEQKLISIVIGNLKEGDSNEEVHLSPPPSPK